MDTGLTATITPTSATSKILVIVSQNGANVSSGSVSNGISVQLFKGATALARPAVSLGYTGTTLRQDPATISITYLDSPATTEATTYKTQFANGTAAAAVQVQRNNNAMSTITLMEIGV